MSFNEVLFAALKRAYGIFKKNNIFKGEKIAIKANPVILTYITFEEYKTK